MNDIAATWKLGDAYPDGWIEARVLTTSAANPRRGNVDEIARSIRTNGWYGALVAQAVPESADRPRILVGNHRYMAGLAVGMERFPVLWVNCTDEEGDRILVVDNRLSDIADWDDAALAAMLAGLASLDGTGFSDVDLEVLLASLDGGDGTDPGDGEGRARSSDVKIQVGTVSFSISRDEWDAWEAALVAEVGARHEDLVAEVRSRLLI